MTRLNKGGTIDRAVQISYRASILTRLRVQQSSQKLFHESQACQPIRGGSG